MNENLSAFDDLIIDTIVENELYDTIIISQEDYVERLHFSLGLY